MKTHCAIFAISSLVLFASCTAISDDEEIPLPEATAAEQECGEDLDCDDSDSCTRGMCFSGKCYFAEIDGCRECSDDLDCFDDDVCTKDICHHGVCEHASLIIEDPEEGEDPYRLCKRPCAILFDCNDRDDCTIDYCGERGECGHIKVCQAGKDFDGDGHTYPGDCDDCRADIYHKAEEICDGRDNDCDGLIDEDAGCKYECKASGEICDRKLCDKPEGCCNSYKIGSAPPVKQCYEYTARYPAEDELFVTLNYKTDCLPHGELPGFSESGYYYYLAFTAENLRKGDVIEHLTIHQTAGQSPLPGSDGEARAAAYLYVSSRVDPASEWFERQSVYLGGVYQEDDGSFTFEDIKIPTTFGYTALVVAVHLSFEYRGYVQFGLMELDDLYVSGKKTESYRCKMPQLGQYAKARCADWDRDGRDDRNCGGTDADDSDPTI